MHDQVVGDYHSDEYFVDADVTVTPVVNVVHQPEEGGDINDSVSNTRPKRKEPEKMCMLEPIINLKDNQKTQEILVYNVVGVEEQEQVAISPPMIEIDIQKDVPKNEQSSYNGIRDSH